MGETNSTLWRLEYGLLYRTISYKKRVNGYTVSSSSSHECLVTQDSGASVEVYTSFVAGQKDKNPKNRLMTLYVIVRDKLEYDYVDFEIFIFYCD